MRVIRCTTKEEAEKRAGDKLNELLKEIGQLPLLLLFAGGSWLKIMDRIKPELFSSRITLGMSDERFSPDPKVNNFAQLRSTLFFEKLQEKEVYFIDTRPGAREGLEELAMRFEQTLKTWIKEHPKGKIFLTQGMGQDGHTAGIMPYPEDKETFQGLFENENRWVVGYNAGKKNEYPLRLTITLPFLRITDYSVAYIVGQEKKEALNRLLQEQGSLEQTPARIMREMKEVALFTDIS